MINAAQAREMSEKTAEEEVIEIMPLIVEAAAKKKKRELTLRTDFWANCGYNSDAKYLEAKKILENLGYTVDFHYHAGPFEDMWTLIKW